MSAEAPSFQTVSGHANMAVVRKFGNHIYYHTYTVCVSRYEPSDSLVVGRNILCPHPFVSASIVQRSALASVKPLVFQSDSIGHTSVMINGSDGHRSGIGICVGKEVDCCVSPAVPRSVRKSSASSYLCNHGNHKKDNHMWKKKSGR